MKRYFFSVLVFVLWIVGFYLATGTVGQDLIDIVSKASPLHVALGFLFYAIAVITSTLILYRCLRYAGLKPPLLGVSKAWIFGSFIDNVVPTITPVGEAAMAYFLEKFYKVSYVKSLAAIGMYVSSWGISVSLYSVFAVLITEYAVGIPNELLIPIILIVVIFMLLTLSWFVLIMRKKLVESIVCKIVKFYNRAYNLVKRGKVSFEPCVYKMEFERSYSTLQGVMKDKKHIGISVAIFGIPQVMHVFCLYAILAGFGANVSVFDVLMIHMVSSMAGLISFIPSGLGVYEIASGGGLAVFGVEKEFAIGAIFLYRLIFVWTTNFIGGLVGVIQGAESSGKFDL